MLKKLPMIICSKKPNAKALSGMAFLGGGFFVL